MALGIGFLIVLAGIVWIMLKFRTAVGSAVENDQLVTSVVNDLTGELDALVEEAAGSSPEAFEHWLRQRIAERVANANAIEEAFRELVALIAAQLCRRCVETWVASQQTPSATSLFAVHDFMRDYDVSESVANSGAYEHLSPSQLAALEAMPENDRLEGSMRSRAKEWLGDDEGAVRRLGQVEVPVAADIYGCVA